MTRDELLRLADRVTDRDWCSDDIAALARHCAEMLPNGDDDSVVCESCDARMPVSAAAVDADGPLYFCGKCMFDELRQCLDALGLSDEIGGDTHDACVQLKDRFDAAIRERDEARERVTVLEQECASISAEFDLPPTMRPVEGHIRNMRKTMRECADAADAYKAERDAALAKVKELEGHIGLIEKARHQVRKAQAPSVPYGDKRDAESGLAHRIDKASEYVRTQPARLAADVLPPIDANDERIVDGMVAAKTNAMGTRPIGGGANGTPPIPPPGSVRGE